MLLQFYFVSPWWQVRQRVSYGCCPSVCPPLADVLTDLLPVVKPGYLTLVCFVLFKDCYSFRVLLPYPLLFWLEPLHSLDSFLVVQNVFSVMRFSSSTSSAVAFAFGYINKNLCLVQFLVAWGPFTWPVSVTGLLGGDPKCLWEKCVSIINLLIQELAEGGVCLFLPVSSMCPGALACPLRLICWNYSQLNMMISSVPSILQLTWEVFSTYFKEHKMGMIQPSLVATTQKPGDIQNYLPFSVPKLFVLGVFLVLGVFCKVVFLSSNFRHEFWYF